MLCGRGSVVGQLPMSWCDTSHPSESETRDSFESELESSGNIENKLRGLAGQLPMSWCDASYPSATETTGDAFESEPERAEENLKEVDPGLFTQGIAIELGELPHRTSFPFAEPDNFVTDSMTFAAIHSWCGASELAEQEFRASIQYHDSDISSQSEFLQCRQSTEQDFQCLPPGSASRTPSMEEGLEHLEKLEDNEEISMCSSSDHISTCQELPVAETERNQQVSMHSAFLHSTLSIEKTDGRGKHWRKKVQEGQFPTPSKGNVNWAFERKTYECHFRSAVLTYDKANHVLPWEEKDHHGEFVYLRRGNTAKVLYMELITMHAKAIIINLKKLGGRSSFFGLIQFTVPLTKRSEFDSTIFPSADSKKRKFSLEEAKKAKKMWETAGWKEFVNGDGSLTYMYDESTYAKQREQQPSQTKRRKIIDRD